MSVILQREPRLNERQKRLLTFLQHFTAEKGYPPTIREIVHSLDFSSTSVVSYHLDRLVRLGLLEKDTHVSRGIKLVNHHQPGGMVNIPLFEKVLPHTIQVIPQTDRYQSLPGEWLVGMPLHKVYAVRVNTHLMYDAMVNEGDVIVLLHQHDTREGDTVLTTIQSKPEPRIRRIYYEGDTIRLAPLMGAFQAQSLPKEQVQVVGKVLGLLRQF